MQWHAFCTIMSAVTRALLNRKQDLNEYHFFSLNK